jgi:hypothetical protein
LRAADALIGWADVWGWRARERAMCDERMMMMPMLMMMMMPMRGVEARACTCEDLMDARRWSRMRAHGDACVMQLCYVREVRACAPSCPFNLNC